MASLPLFLVVFLVLGGGLISGQQNSDGIMEREELLGLFEVLGGLLEDPSWAQEHPQPCDETPWPGIQCEIGDENPPSFHVTKIHIGPDILTPPCKSSASLSSSLLKLPYLKTLSIFNCFLTTPVTLSPSLFGALSSLETLALVSNPALSGEIPPELSKITNLRVLSLSQNNLLGNIPREIGVLVRLEQLDLSYNNLSGEIPQEIGGLGSLTILDLSWNVLEGQVPSSVGQLQVLQKIDMSCNMLRGLIPPNVGQLKRLVLFDLSHNLINGPIPETLSGCGLIGKLPNSLSSLKNLSSLSLDNNSLNGTVPTSLGTLPKLDQLNLSNNQLSGALSLPEDFIGRLGKRLDVRGNNGLCAINPLYKKGGISANLISAPVCLNASGATNDTALAGEDKEPKVSERMKPFGQYPVENNSSGSPSNSNAKMVSFGFVVCFLCLLL
ncbi:hypothetical protein ACFX13_037206 [Malus domestica]